MLNKNVKLRKLPCIWKQYFHLKFRKRRDRFLTESTESHEFGFLHILCFGFGSRTSNIVPALQNPQTNANIQSCGAT
jgi:hypothetical protein